VPDRGIPWPWRPNGLFPVRRLIPCKRTMTGRHAAGPASTMAKACAPDMAETAALSQRRNGRWSFGQAIGSQTGFLLGRAVANQTSPGPLPWARHSSGRFRVPNGRGARDRRIAAIRRRLLVITPRTTSANRLDGGRPTEAAPQARRVPARDVHLSRTQHGFTNNSTPPNNEAPPQPKIAEPHDRLLQ